MSEVQRTVLSFVSFAVCLSSLTCSVFVISLFPLENYKESQSPVEQSLRWLNTKTESYARAEFIFKMRNQGRTMQFFDYINKYTHSPQEKKTANLKNFYQ